MTEPIGSVSPAATTIVSTPAASDSYVSVALSVSISASGSPRATASPSAFSHFRIVPSSIESDSRGMTISVIGVSASSSWRARRR